MARPGKRTATERTTRKLVGRHLMEDRARDRMREGWQHFENRLQDVKFYLADIEAEVKKRLKGRKRPLQVMDLGCGAGNAAKELAEIFGDKVEVTGTGLSRHHKWTDRLGGSPKNVRWRVLHAGQLARKFSKNHFDLIYSNYGIYHDVNLKQALENAREILKPGGVIIFNALEEEVVLPVKGLRKVKQAAAPNGHVTFWLKKVSGKKPRK